MYTFKYNVIDAEENQEVTIAYGVKKAPTLIVPNEKDSYDVYENASNIKKFIEESN